MIVALLMETLPSLNHLLKESDYDRRIIIFCLLFELLAYETLMLCSVVIVREYLCKQHIHVVSLLVLPRIHCGSKTHRVTMERIGCLSFLRYLIFQAFLAKIKHLTSKSLGHNRLTWGAGDRVQWAIHRCLRVWGLWLDLVHMYSRVISSVLGWPVQIRIR